MEFVKMTRNGVPREFEAHNVPYHEKRGWRKVGDKPKAAPTEPKEVDTMDLTKSTYYKGNPVGKKEMKTYLEGKELEDVNSFFDGEERESVLKLKSNIIKKLEDGND